VSPTIAQTPDGAPKGAFVTHRADRRAVALAFPGGGNVKASGATVRREHDGVCPMHYPPLFPARAEPETAATPSARYAARDAENTKVLRWRSDMLCL
jgi:hypothetical protein